ncbi:uncharacterized protein K444DRAFT_613439 [Hyaloscypha bicolor E]|uniref:Uncharacterized protein n=1 Tax=Hyaloscypha bicolor E TaxID=1095630 RepID=A0A2J6T8X4_9HELO|nr:uncharacterized protein K444DRAFT_613439 [Hyaloscypha bicolor E]PMD59480.1 hypothetical protein K444DRAFT_613439 [Hyaloscypha bicolor E]
MLPLPSIIVAIQGLLGILNGARYLLIPSIAEKDMATLHMTSLPALHAIALGSLTIGWVTEPSSHCSSSPHVSRTESFTRTFYLNAAFRGDKIAICWMILGRVIAIPIFLGHGGPWLQVAEFEAVCVFSTLAALGWENFSGSRAARQA